MFHFLFRYFSSIGNSRIDVQSQWLTDCEVDFLGRINGLPDIDQYDYQIGWIFLLNEIDDEGMICFLVVCKNGSCLLQIDRLSPFIWIYFRASVRNLSCLNNPVRGSIMLQSIGWRFRRFD